MKKKSKKKPTETLNKDAWRELVKGVTECPMYDLAALSAKAGVDVRTASIFFADVFALSQSSKALSIHAASRTKNQNRIGKQMG